MEFADTLNKIKRRLFYSAYDSISESQFVLSVARAFSQILQCQKQKKELVTAYTDVSLYGLTEALSDCGFVCGDPTHTFFGGDPHDSLHPYNPKEELKKFAFDVVLGPSGIDLVFFAKKVKQALSEVKLCNFRTCLNLHKILIIGALVCLIPDNSTIVEVGSYQCGTTIFMAQLCKALKKKVKILACDTFEGMPAATDQDRADSIFYDAGMFIDNPLSKVLKRIKKQHVDDYIDLLKGDVIDTLPNLSLNDVSLVFLDTDQYKGTKAGLDLVERLNLRPHIIIDDTSLSSVGLAIDEFLNRSPFYVRKNLFTNFDYVIPRQGQAAFMK